MNIKITFTEPLLGTLAGDKELATEYILGKRENGVASDEVEALNNTPEEVLEKATTIFAKDKEGVPMLWDYMIKGFFKDACSMLRRVPGTKSSKVAAHKKIIDGLIFPAPRKIQINVVGDIKILERPLRAETAQGPRIALARSESIPAGSFININVTCLDKKLEPLVREWLDYGALRGLGQWRNGSYGRFMYEESE